MEKIHLPLLLSAAAALCNYIQPLSLSPALDITADNHSHSLSLSVQAHIPNEVCSSASSSVVCGAAEQMEQQRETEAAMTEE